MPYLKYWRNLWSNRDTGTNSQTWSESEKAVQIVRKIVKTSVNHQTGINFDFYNTTFGKISQRGNFFKRLKNQMERLEENLDIVKQNQPDSFSDLDMQIANNCLAAMKQDIERFYS